MSRRPGAVESEYAWPQISVLEALSRDPAHLRAKVAVAGATKYYKLQENDTPGVQPDQRVEPTWAAFRAGSDPALEWTLAQPRNR
jgi:hypothetical protein